MKTKKHPNLARRIVLSSITVLLLGAIVASSIVLYNYTSEQLYQESITQLTELSTQLFEKLKVQVDLQWGYLDKLKSDLEEKSSWDEADIKKELFRFEKDLAPSKKTIMFRVLDEDGYYYTDEGKQGYWTGNEYLDDDDDDERKSFLITNWSDNENYMAFVTHPSAEVSIGSKAISRFILLRSMSDMAPFFHSSAFNNKNLAYVTDEKGFILYQTGSLEGVNYEGKNVFSFWEKQTFPHADLESLTQKVAKGEVIYTDIIINGARYYLIHNPLKQYDWEVTILVSASDVAKSSTSMVESLIKIFLILMVIFMVLFGVGIFFITKITRDKALIKTKEENQAHLEQINQELIKSQKEAEEALAIARYATNAKSQFLANMSHDIRTPMNAIVGISKLMEHETSNPEKLAYYISKLRHSSEYMLGLINDILDMSKIESGDVHLNLAPVKLAEQVGQIESIIRAQSNEKEQEFTVYAYGIKHEYLIGDSVRIRQLFMNLLSNAVKYTPNGGHIRYEIKELPSEKEGYAKFLTSVIDDGYGMSKEFQQKMFEPFAREVNSMTNKVSGTGLGLPITKSVIEMMGGSITCDSEIGKGTRFEVSLEVPIDTDDHARSDIKNVLLISEEELLITNLYSAFSEREAALQVVKNEQEALAYLEGNKVDVILLSGYLSKADLKDTVTHLKEKQDTLVFCCDYAYKEHVREALVSSGVDGLIARPFFFDNLLVAIDGAKKATTSEEGARSFLNGKRFLCAEDNELNAEILEALLTMNGATCKIYPNGEEIVKAFSSVKKGDYDAILMDVQMPVMNGLKATKAIRESENPFGKEITIIAMTANAFSSDVKECLEAGMDAHLAKPLDVNALEHLLQRLLNNEPATNI